MMGTKESKTSRYYRWLKMNRQKANMENEQREKFMEDLKRIRSV